MIELEERQETVILVAVDLNNGEEVEQSLQELEELAETSGAKTCAKVIQARESFHPGTYVGKGKLEELRELLYAYEATGIICDDELSPAQMSNLAEQLDTKVMDRTMIILDIFAKRASSAEGKVQVELAQQRYHLSHLVGYGAAMSRLGGGIGTRGPGEKKLEMDRRLIRNRISQLKQELSGLQRHRQINRESRQRSQLKTFAIVGYTNAGKSTLLNSLTDAGVPEEDQLFATLDPTTRKLQLGNKQEVLLTDTVGFIRKLPHHLIEAFHSTLEEAKYADYLIHVIDSSNSQWEEQIRVVYQTLDQLGVKGKQIITIFNKMDRLDENSFFSDSRADYILKAAIKSGIGLEMLKDAMETVLRSDKFYIEVLFSYEEGGKTASIRKYGELLSEEYQENGILIKAYIPFELKGKLGLE